MLVPGERLELSRYRYRWILSPLRLPFRHPGREREGCKYKDFRPPGKRTRHSVAIVLSSATPLELHRHAAVGRVLYDAPGFSRLVARP